MKMPLPRRYELLSDNGSKVIRQYWRSLRTAFLAVFWVIITVFFLPNSLKGLTLDELSEPIAWLDLIPLFLSIGLAYGLAASFFNKTDIIMGRSVVEIKHYPLWWPGQKKLNAADIIQVYVTEKVTRHGGGGADHHHHSHTTTTTNYHIYALDRSDRRISLMGGLHDKQEAKFIETKMEEALGIEDERVSGAV